MIFCEKCFKDSEIVPIIRNFGIVGECQICHSKDVYIYNTEKNEQLIPLFDDLISIYTPISLLPVAFPKSETRLLKDELLRNWEIFNNINESDIYKIITSVCKDKYIYNSELFDQPIGLRELYEEEYLMQHSLLTTNSWKDFVEALKTKNRFHTHYINLELLDKFCSYIRKPYKKGTTFFRGRISTASGLSKNEMGAPPSDKATDGRANAAGISCLYLGESRETTIHEIRAGAYDFISIGEFVLKEDIIVVDLKRINRISPFIEGFDCREHAINKEHLNKINDEMGKALRRSDSILDYVPTQYIVDFIKSIRHDDKYEYAAVEYNSVMNTNGYNLAVFYADLFECVNVETYKIDELHYHKHKI
ncbi:RES family NAD+ phosphorylase [Anaerocolumna xylanovorans]|uniref:RES domain-containing protein n=1 Tax=Anaerocolumna xylanovorans DSM 12503 TaxID=1121345 RepID=A0A1M7Y8K2_9FIRM|nr:RES family NAD+ phosphorylase [Anaerocolumna xylanovorans]SHO48963.1 RES domain-containing protein [Anaerocolumna xylanovorans DSM 12503]